MKSVAFSGTLGHVPGLPFMSTATAMQRVGLNCGNLVFQYAVARLIDEPVKVLGLDTSWNPAEIRNDCRVAVVPSANFIREGVDFGTFVGFLEKLELPLVFIGLGAQADSYDQTEFDFHPSVLRLIDLIRERSPAVSLRGEFTQRVLDRFGVQNAVVTGCPSNFINPAPDFPDQIERKHAAGMRSYITQADEPWPKKPKKAEVEKRLVEWTRSGPSVMVQQSVPSMIAYLRRENPFADDTPSEKFEASLARKLMPEASIEEFRDFVLLKIRTYYAVDQWIEDSSKFDFSVGLRLHGNMAAWQSGTPALWITHDSRTRELVETMALPNIDIDDFLENCATVQDAWDRFEFDKAGYAVRRTELRQRVVDVLAAFDIAAVPAPAGDGGA